MSSSPSKTALITGSTKGIGKAIAHTLSSQGFNIVLNSSSPSNADTEALIEELGGKDRAICIQADMGSVKEIERLVDETVKWRGGIDVVVANAGVMPLSELDKVTEEEFDRVFNINVKGPLFLVQKAAPHLTPSARIVLFSTTLAAASTVQPSYLTYLSSKGAIEQMTRALSKDFARREITVNCVAPGPTATDLFLKGKSEQVINAIAGNIPSKRLGTPEEIAGVVGFLCGEQGKWISGQVLRVNGGMA